ncbi:glycosyltransferase family 2 protein [Bacillus sp. MM2020_1]|nr:glycosyltransferase family 2 protein [Bacillus sp. MM2020_1]
MEPHKISVIVPIYKVEKYINRCVDSIINQSYTNLEIILVDDGSPDRCGEIIDNYAKADKRIKVIHKNNGGLSDARNKGMQNTSGDFLLFVDSDDWLENQMIAELVQHQVKFQADVVQVAFFYTYEDYLLFDNRYYQRGDAPVVLDNKALMKELVINERVKNFAWGKLYKTEIIKDLPFKKGVLFEDVFWAHQVMQKVKTYVIIHQPLYYYIQRSDSIVSNYTPKNLDIIKGLMERQCFIEEYYQHLSNESYKVLTKTILIHYNLLLLNRYKDQDGKYKKELQQLIKKNYIKLKKAVTNDKDLNWQLRLFYVHPFVNVFYLFFKKLVRKVIMNPNTSELEKINL